MHNYNNKTNGMDVNSSITTLIGELIITVIKLLSNIA